MDIAPLLDIPEVKPAIEQIAGRREQKMSPKRRHAIMQFRLGRTLSDWAGDAGEVGSEWRCYFFPADGEPSSLVPDVSYYSFERLPRALGEAREQPTVAPDIAVEVLSPDERKRTLQEKIALYFAFGARAVMVVDPARRTVVTFETVETSRLFGAGESVTLDRYPDLHIELDALFRNLD